MSALPVALPPALAAERRQHQGRAGRLSYYLAGPAGGAPLLLLHSVNAAASAYEVKPVFEPMVATRRIYAPDLPGFGFSDRSARDYTIRLYVDAVHDMLDVIAADCGEQPVDVLALSLSAEFAARAAGAAPQRFRTLALVTPTGFSRLTPQTGRREASREIPGLHRLVSVPLWSGGLFRLLSSRASIRFFLQRTYGSAAVDPGLIDYAYSTSHQPGAEHAPFAFLAGRLFSSDVRPVYEALRLPVWVPHATLGDFRDFSGADWARAKPNWRWLAMPTGALPHFEQPDTFCAAYRAFLQSA